MIQKAVGNKQAAVYLELFRTAQVVAETQQAEYPLKDDLGDSQVT
jgi:hypothetical protein